MAICCGSVVGWLLRRAGGLPGRQSRGCRCSPVRKSFHIESALTLTREEEIDRSSRQQSHWHRRGNSLTSGVILIARLDLDRAVAIVGPKHHRLPLRACDGGEQLRWEVGAVESLDDFRCE